jgi:pimeloyl-ACP methyl ester carboxylesterase
MKQHLLNVTLAVVLTAILSACNGAPPDTADESANDAVTVGEHAFTAADGSRMPYTVAGAGDVTVVLVHCWMCNRTFWSEQIPVLTREYRTIAVDLPGHGDASADRNEWTVAAFGDDVGALIESLDLSNVVLVGHSMGGPVSLRAAAIAGDRVRGVIAVDTLHDAEFDFSGEQMEAFMTAFESDFVGTCREFVQQMFPEDGADATMNRVRETSCSEQRAPVGVALMRDFGTIDMPRWLSEAGVPIRAINAAAPNATQVETNRKYADFDVELMENVGHYLHMTRPEQFNPLLLEAIEEVLNAT